MMVIHWVILYNIYVDTSIIIEHSFISLRHTSHTQRRKLGPGAYNTMIGGFSTKSVEHKASGPGWARQLEVERLASLPHLLYKEQWEENRMLVSAW